MTTVATDTLPARPVLRRDGVTWAGYLALALFTFFLNIQGNILPFLRDEFGLSYRLVTLHPAAVAGGLLLSGAFGAPVTARLGRRRAIGIGLLGLCLGSLMLMLAPSPAISILGCLVMGTLGGFVLIVVPAMLAEWHGENRSLAIGEANGICYIASLAAAISMGVFVYLGLDWRMSLAFGILLGLAALAAFRSVPLPARPPRPAGASGRLPAAYWLYWLAIVCFVSLEQSTLVWAPEFLESVKGLTRASAATAAGIFSVGMLIGRMSAALLLARFEPRRVLHVSLVMTLPAYAVYWLAPSAAVSIGGLFVLGLGTALLYPIAISAAIGLCGTLGELASARASIASGVSILIVPALIGWLADLYGLTVGLGLLPLLALVSFGFLAAARRLEVRGPEVRGPEVRGPELKAPA